MKQSINLYQFRRAFELSERTNFSYDGQEVLFNYLEELEEDTDEEIELDILALCCEYVESDYQYIADSYYIDLSECDEEDEKIEVVKDYLNDNTVLCGEVNRGFVYLQF